MSVRSAAPLCLAFVLSCSAEPRGVATMKVAVPPSPSAVGTAARLDLELFSPLLSAPDLRVAAEALESGDATRAAHEVETLLKRRPPDDKTRSFDLLLGRLREAAMDFAGAATAYAAAAASPWALSGYAWLGEGRALRRAGHPSEALSVLRKVPAEVHEDARLESAEAALALGDPSLALVVWREHLAKESASDDVVPLSLRLGELLVTRALAAPPGDPEVPAAGREALSLARRALARVTEPVQTARARALEGKALALLPEPERAAHALPSPEEDLERLAALVDAKQFLDAVPLANGLVAALGSAATPQSCAAWLLRARALAGIHDLRGAETEAADAGAKCEDTDDRAQGLFLAGKYATEDKRFADAIRHYETLEASCPGHRLADDARLKRALCYKELGADDRFTELLTRLPDDYPGGDMVLDGMFALATFRIEKGDWAGAATVLERATSMAGSSDTKRGQEFAGRERYFRARAWGELGEKDKSLAEYEGIIRDLPLSYYMLHAYSRLEAADAPRASRALEDAEKRSAANAFTFARVPAFDSPGFTRALELLRVGDVADASREMDALGVLKATTMPQILWAIALLYARAGAAKLSHEVTDGLLTDWLGRWPSGDWSRAWQVAFPRPYHDVVSREAKHNNVAESLVYAVMREESSFDPEAESPAKAYGLMQLIGPTARQYGRLLGLHPTPLLLLRPSVNIAIGCRLLAELAKAFPENPLLEIPGYNAGLGRSRQWEAERPTVDFDVWVESIPYLETRRYTKRVLAARAAYEFLYDHAAPGDALRLPIRLRAP